MKYFSAILVLASVLLCNVLTGQIDESKRYSEETLKKESKFIAASQLQLLGQYEEAIEKFRVIAKDEPDNAVVYFQLSRCYEFLKDYEAAIKNARKAYDLDSDNEYFALQLAEAYEGNLEYDKAAETYLSYTEKHPSEAFFYERAVFYYLKLKEYKSAISVLNDYEKAIGIREDITRQKFEIYSKQGESKKAVKELTRLCKAYPNREKFSLNLANYYLKLGEVSKAKDVFKDLLDKDPDNQTALRFLSLSDSPATSDELNYLRVVAADIPNKKITLDQKISKIMPSLKAFIDKRDVELGEELIRVTKTLTEIYPEDAKSHAIYADVLKNMGQLNEAILAYKTTVGLNGGIFDVWYQLMVAQKQQGLYEDLLNTSEDALLRFPNQSVAYLFNGHALNLNNKPGDALEILNEAIVIAGDQLSLRNNIRVEQAHAIFLQGALAKATEMLTDDLLVTADSWELKGDIQLQQGDLEKAVLSWKKALKIEPNNKKLSDKISQNQI